MFKYATIGLLCAVVALGGLLGVQYSRVSALKVENDALTASVASFKLERELAREAQDVAEARQKFVEAKASEYDEIREGILRDGEDAALPIWMLDAIIGLRPGPDDEANFSGDPD